MRNLLALLLLMPFLLGAQQHYTFSTTGPLRGALPQIDGELFGFYLVPADQIGPWPIAARIRWVDDRGVAGEWQGFRPDDHAPDRLVSKLYHELSNTRSFQLQLPVGTTATLHIYDPGSTQALGPQPGTEAIDCAAPVLQERLDWCPAGNCPVDPTPAATTVTHLIVHHSATTNNATDWAAVVRSIWDFHVNGRGWDDIGYNYLVDPNGAIYVGRGNNIRGAHFCGNNTGTLGNCVLGDFTDETPSSAALAALGNLLAWEASSRDIDPTAASFHAASELTLNHVSGHREGCETSCPGDQFFPLFAGLRTTVEDVINNCDPVAVDEPAWAAEVEVYPNPGYGKIYLDGLPVDVNSFQLFNVSGQVVLQGGALLTGDFIDATRVKPAGLYYLRLNTDVGRVVRKIVIN